MSKQIINNQLEDQIVEFYKTGLSASEIRYKLGAIFKTNKTIYDILARRNITRRESREYREPLNESFFRRIDSPIKAYILGLLITDGWILKERPVVGFSSIDKELTELIHKALELGNRTITIRPGGNVKICDKNVNTKDSYQIQVTDNTLYSSLKNLGFASEKTRHEILPSVSENLESHLIRGIFDGDGCVYKLSGVKQPGLIFYSGSQVLLWQISSIILKHLYIDIPKIQPVTTIHKISYFADLDVQSIIAFLYRDAHDLCSKRKWQTILNIYEN